MNKLVNSAMKLGFGAAIVVLASANGFGQPVVADTILYSNSANSTGQVFNPGAGVAEFGDQVNLNNAGVAGMSYLVKSFSFETFGSGIGDSNTSPATAILRFYGADSTQTLGLGALEVKTFPFQVVDGFQTHTIDLPTPFYAIGDAGTFFWTVEFENVPGAGSIGLTLADPPTIGSSLSDFVQFTTAEDASTFSLKTFGDSSNANFTATVFGDIVTIPEPGTAALALLGGFALLGLRRKR
ncbi:MAG: PEP-CTERM sorting domain-containing protein [Verrucomicrobia bacterium]|nr:PEP-CTERM sorting domain-containing protein [Verrucomicrobiota bacterium]